MPPCSTIHMPACRTLQSWPQTFQILRAPQPCLSRAYASKPGAPKRPSRFVAKPISLDHFLMRGRVLSLYRTIIRGCRKVSSPGSKKEMVELARYEFKRNKDVQDLTQIRYLLSTGKTQWEGMERYIDGI